MCVRVRFLSFPGGFESRCVVTQHKRIKGSMLFAVYFQGPAAQ